MLASTCLSEEGVEEIISPPNGFVTRHLAIQLDATLQAIEIPEAIASLDTSLANVDGDAFTHRCCFVASKWMAERKRRGCFFLQHDS